MNQPQHGMADLFAQLGLPSSPAAIEAFLATHRPLRRGQTLPEAPFWTAAQAAFLRDQVAEDADWAGVVDRLDTALRRAGD